MEVDALSEKKSKWSVRQNFSNRLAFYFFCLFLFFLPLFEAPKNIFGVLFLVSGFWKYCEWILSSRDSLWGDHVNTALLVLFFSTFFAGLGLDSSYFRDNLNYAAMPLIALLARVVIEKKRLRLILQIICISSILATIHAFSTWGSNEYPELNSVGHVNQSALYLVFSMIVGGALLIESNSRIDKVLGLLTVFSAISFFVPSRSLVAAICGGLIILGLFAIDSFRSLSMRRFLVSVAAFVSLFIILLAPHSYKVGLLEPLRAEIFMRLDPSNNSLSERDRFVRSAITVAGDSVFGFGLKNYGDATEIANEFRTTHGHNIFATVLVERGWVGVTAFFLFVVVIFAEFLKRSSEPYAMIGLLTIVIVVIGGLGQTTLHQEHGQLALILLSLLTSPAPDTISDCRC